MELEVIILAAGEGKRMYSAIPKVLHSIGGMPMLERVINTASSLNPESIYVIYGKHGDQLKKRLSYLKVQWVEQANQLGTGHAVIQVMPNTPDSSRVLVLYGDVPLVSKELLQKFLNATPENAIGIITAELENPDNFGRIIRNEKNKIVAIVEQKDADKNQLTIKEINTGILTAPARALKAYLPRLSKNNAQGEYYLTDIIALAIADNNQIYGTIAQQLEEIMGINDKSQQAFLERHHQLQTAKQLMRDGLTLADPARFDLRGELEFAKDVFIDVNVIIEGKVSIGPNSSIGPNTILRNIKIGDNVKVLANCVLEDAVIENNCKIGPFARIRPETRVKSNAQIGNFVELKKTTLGKNSKANHLSYLGDTTIGKGVNIGAGTITCNYDGVNKYPTVIEDDAFIGSNANLVAPVKIGKNATIGAGSTITEDTPDNQLTLARNRQCSIKDWKRPEKK